MLFCIINFIYKNVIHLNYRRILLLPCRCYLILKSTLMQVYKIGSCIVGQTYLTCFFYNLR